MLASCLFIRPPLPPQKKKTVADSENMTLSLNLVEMLKFFPMTIDNFEGALTQLYLHLFNQSFVGFKDYKYVSAWIDDLKQQCAQH